ncbi:glutathione S-transferase family protein [Pseudorhizobium endolithicum]|uniref:Glutathione S-transferase family protein n=1 Tax=Pseudorhizobium endolithicum TaxID=1191678 RepID=A0ABM8PGB4_9HYPH|nr:glutathione S-transferase family protein [Pseudorhizobium endolithicum]CAD6421997.1 glutathione S-transferase family protein [Rhizobium sp. Q54]CAD7028299.1 glutathione S-transferase family protein [Pseudorhizobium endolithicum]
MLTIYGVYRSRATRPLWLIEELGLPHRHEPVIQAYRLPEPSAADAPFNTRSPEFLAINPMGSIPSMDDDGFVLHESLAITLYLAKKYGGDLGPKDLAEDAQMVQWALFSATSIETPALDIQKAIGDGLSETTEGKAKITASAGDLERPFDVLEAHLTAHSHILGDRFTAADIIVAEIVRYAQGHAPLFASRPALKAWLEACQARPAFKVMWEKRLREPA